MKKIVIAFVLIFAIFIEACLNSQSSSNDKFEFNQKPLKFKQIVIQNTGIITVTDSRKTEVFSGSLIIDTADGVYQINIDPSPLYDRQTLQTPEAILIKK